MIAHAMAILLLSCISATGAKNAAVLVETRHTPALLYAINQAHRYLPDDFDIILITNTNIKNQLSKRTVLEDTDNRSNNRTILYKTMLKETLTRHEYNALIKRKDLYDTTLKEYEWLLFFQTDTTFCRPFDLQLFQSSQLGYVGSAWSTPVVSPPQGFSCASLRDRSLPRAYIHVGNGGFSLRHRRRMLEIVDRWYGLSGHLPFNEDVWFACGSHYLGSLANLTTANAFAIESIPFKEGMQVPFGVHKPWKYQSDSDLKRLESLCTPLTGLMEVNRVSHSAYVEEVGGLNNESSVVVIEDL